MKIPNNPITIGNFGTGYYGNLSTGIPFNFEEIKRTNIEGELFYKGKPIEETIQDLIKEAIEVLLGKDKLKEYEDYLNTKKLVEKTDESN